MKLGHFTAALLLGAAGCRSSSLGPFPDASVVLISIDTLRADRLSPYGYKEGSTPVLESFAREGIVFEDLYLAVLARLGSLGFAPPASPERLLEQLGEGVSEPGQHVLAVQDASRVDVSRLCR